MPAGFVHLLRMSEKPFIDWEGYKVPDSCSHRVAAVAETHALNATNLRTDVDVIKAV
jgi:hypothetical protein